MSTTRLYELEDTESLDRWEEALYKCEAIIIPDTEIYKDTHPKEYEVYKRLGAKSILAVSF